MAGLNIFIMRLLFTIFFLCIVLGTHAQSGFRRLYSGETTGATFVDIAWDGKKLYTTGQFLADTTLPNGALNGQLYMELDTNGNVLFTDIYFPPNDAVTSGIKNTIATFDSSTFYITTQMYNATNENQLTIYKDSDRIATKSITTSGLRTAIYHSKKVNSGVLLSGFDHASDYTSDGLLVMVNDEGEELWRKYYDFQDNYCNLFEPYILGSNSIILTGADQKLDFSGPPANNWIKTWFAMIDSNGVIQSEWRSPPNSEIGVATRLIQLPNKQWLYATSQFIFNPNPFDSYGLRPKIVCRDSNFNFVWERPFECYPLPNTYTIDLQPSRDGNFLLTGRLALSEQFGGGFIRKISPTGETVWNYFDPIEIANPFELANGGLVEIPSGSVFVAGYALDLNGGKAYGLLTKLNKNGCRDSLCTNTSETKNVAGMPKVGQVFPNPTTGPVTVTNTVGDFIRVFDLGGRLAAQFAVVSERQTIDLQGLPPGNYLLQMQDKTLRLTYQIIKI